MKKSGPEIILLIMAGMILFPVIAFGEMDISHTDDGFKIKTDDQWIKFGGTLMWDIDSASGAFWDFEDDDDAWNTRSEFRRARLNIKAKIAENWKAKLQFEFAGNDASDEVKDAYVEYSGWQMINILVGQEKEPFGLEAIRHVRLISGF
jgi:phosphate-selective porin OprO and OprP